MSYPKHSYNQEQDWFEQPSIYRTGLFYGSESLANAEAKKKVIKVRKKPLSIRILEYIFDVN